MEELRFPKFDYYLKGLPHYDYGRAFRITERGRALLLKQHAGGAGP